MTETAAQVMREADRAILLRAIHLVDPGAQVIDGPGGTIIAKGGRPTLRTALPVAENPEPRPSIAPNPDATGGRITGMVLRYGVTYEWPASGGRPAHRERFAPGAAGVALRDMPAAVPLMVSGDPLPVGRAIGILPALDGIRVAWQLDTRASARAAETLIAKGLMLGLSPTIECRRSTWRLGSDGIPEVARDLVTIRSVFLTPLPAMPECRLFDFEQGYDPNRPALSAARTWAERMTRGPGAT